MSIDSRVIMLLSMRISFIKLMLKYRSEKEAHDNIGITYML